MSDRWFPTVALATTMTAWIIAASLIAPFRDWWPFLVTYTVMLSVYTTVAALTPCDKETP